MTKDLNEANLNNLFFISKVLSHVEHFVFFGTLLGLTRDGQLIDGDDDIDIYIDIQHFDIVFKLLFEHDCLIRKRKGESCFLQVEKKVGNVTSYIDFYFFQHDRDNGLIKEKWNFNGAPQLESHHIHIPSSLIYPIKTIKVNQTEICIPNQPELMCEFLYGKNWKRPLKKMFNIKFS